METEINDVSEFNSLTKRELQVLDLMAQGLTNFEITKELGITISTLASHIVGIYSKINDKFGQEGFTNQAVRVRVVLKYLRWKGVLNDIN